MRDDRDRLFDILQAIDRILTKTSGAQSAFHADEIETEQVWKVVEQDLPPLRMKVQELIYGRA